MKKTLITILATVLVCCCAVGGTLAWLMDKTETITNTFTVGNVDIELTETKGTTTDNKAFSYKMVPGNTIEKDPTITVESGSEECYVFVKVEVKNNTFTDASEYLTVEMADGWTVLSGDLYYYNTAVNALDAAQTIHVLKNDQVKVNDSVTKAMMDAIGNDNKPTIVVTAYAVQVEAGADATAAWNATFGA